MQHQVDGDRLFTIEFRGTLDAPRRSSSATPTRTTSRSRLPRRARRRLRRRPRGLRERGPGQDETRSAGGSSCATGAPASGAASPISPSRSASTLRADGRVVADARTTASIYDVPPGGAAAGSRAQPATPALRRRAHRLRARADGRAARASTRAAASAPFGVPTDGARRLHHRRARRVLWAANDCLLVAAGHRARRRGARPGPCPRSELTRRRRPRTRAWAARIPVTLRCVAAPARCRGTLRLRRADGRALNRRAASRSPRDARARIRRPAHRARLSRAAPRGRARATRRAGRRSTRATTATACAERPDILVRRR